MMNKSALLFLLTFCFLHADNSFGQFKQLKEKRIHQILHTTGYNNAKSTDIKEYGSKHKKEYQINLFKADIYNMVLNASPLAQEIITSSGKKKTKDETFDVNMKFQQKNDDGLPSPNENKTWLLLF